MRDAVSPLTDTPGNTASNVSSPAMPTTNANAGATVNTSNNAGMPGTKQRHTPSGWSNSSIDASANPTTLYDLSAFINPTPPPPGLRRAHDPSLTSGGGKSSYPFSSGSALYSTQQEMAFAHSSMQLPELPSMNNNAGGGGGGGSMQPFPEDPDPMFWGNADFALADVFGSATWEQMTAPTPGLGKGPIGPWDGGGI